MVNKCSVIGCQSLYMNEKVKLHRFPLDRENILPLWIAITGRDSSWNPNQSSRLCCNHFIESDYILGHKKGILKPTAIPSIEYRVIIPRHRRHKHNQELFPAIRQLHSLNQLITVVDIVGQ